MTFCLQSPRSAVSGTRDPHTISYPPPMKRSLQVLVVAFICLVGAGISQGISQQAGAQSPSLNSDSAEINAVHRIYQDFLGRRATTSELDRFVPRFGVGQDENDVRARVLGSRAFFEHVGATRGDFVNAVYRQVLGRSPTDSEFTDTRRRLANSQLSLRLARQGLADELLDRADYDPDGLGVREIVLHTNNAGDITRFAFELDEAFETTDATSLTVSIGGQEVSGQVRVRAFEQTISLVPDQPVERFGKIVALAFVGQDGTTRLADISAASNRLPPRTPDAAPWPDRVFEDQRVIANYGSHVTSRLGVLGETGPEAAVTRVQAAAAPFSEPGRPAIGAFEMIVTVAQASAGGDGNFSHPSELDGVEEWIDIAEKAGVYVILDIQPGRSDFLTESVRYESLLLRPHVGLALDPEWRMGPTQRPGQVVGQVSAAEVNQVSAWLSDLTLENDLPEKIFMIHQFQERMITNREDLIDRPGLATVIHADGFGGRSEKQATYSRIHVDEPFYNGFKLFIDEDRNIYQPAEVLSFTSNPVPDFVSYQ